MSDGAGPSVGGLGYSPGVENSDITALTTLIGLKLNKPGTDTDDLVLVSSGSGQTSAAATGVSITSGTNLTATGTVTGGSLTTAGTLNAGTSTLGATTVDSLTSTGNVSADGAVQTDTISERTAAAGVTVTDHLAVTDATASTSTITGSVTTAGGLGVVENVNIGGNLATGGTVAATGEVSGGSLSTAGTLGAGESTLGAVDATSLMTTGNVLVEGEVQTDIISELTGGAGVTIDGLEVKDNALSFPSDTTSGFLTNHLRVSGAAWVQDDGPARLHLGHLDDHRTTGYPVQILHPCIMIGSGTNSDNYTLATNRDRTIEVVAPATNANGEPNNSAWHLLSGFADHGGHHSISIGGRVIDVANRSHSTTHAPKSATQVHLSTGGVHRVTVSTTAVSITEPTTITDTTASTSPTTGCLIAGGGLGVALEAHIGGAVHADGIIYASSTATSTSTATGCVIASGGLGVAENVNIGGVLDVVDATQSTSTTTGSITTAGGLGVVKDVFIGGVLTVGGETAATTVSATESVTWSGPRVSGAHTVDLVKINNTVFCTFGATAGDGNSTAAVMSGTAISAPFRPSNTPSCNLLIFQDTTYAHGALVINTDGTMRAHVSADIDPFAAWGSTASPAQVGWGAQTVMWTV